MERGLPDEIFLTYRALEGLPLFVRENVSSEDRAIIERLIAVLTFVWAVARVNQLMAFQAAPVLEFPVTLATLKTVLRVARTPQNVFVVEILSRKHSTTHLAFESTLGAMQQHMVFTRGALTKVLVADFAPIQLFGRVYVHVLS